MQGTAPLLAWLAPVALAVVTVALLAHDHRRPGREQRGFVFAGLANLALVLYYLRPFGAPRYSLSASVLLFSSAGLFLLAGYYGLRRVHEAVTTPAETT